MGDMDMEKQFSEAFEAHADELFRHAYLRLSDRERAVELTQETFLRSWEYLVRGGEIREFRPFFYQTLRRLIIDEYRKRKNVSLEAMLFEEDESIEIFLPPDESNTLASAMDRFDATKALEAARKLPPKYSEVLLLRYVEGLSPSEIAKCIDESENVVLVRIHRALRKLREILEPNKS